jgi:hypothetical protein
MNSHSFDINHYPETITNVSQQEHLNTQGHTIKNFCFMLIDKVTPPLK